MKIDFQPIVQRSRIDSTSSNSSSSSSSSSSSDTTSSSSSTSTAQDSDINSNVLNASQDLELPSDTTVAKKEKFVKPPCTEKCRLKCRDKITEEQRQEIFECYWGLGTLQRQRDFLNSCLTTLKVPYRRVKEGAAKTRNQNCVFHFTVNGESKRTCKFFFINTLGISERTLRTVIEGRNSSSTGVIPEGKRGKHAHHNQISPEILQSVRDHINSVPGIESHYTRANTTREFIDGSLTVKELHRNYVSNRGTLASASFDMYYRIFNTEFNLSFFVPKKDQCDLCESYKNAIGEDQLKLKELYEEHLRQKQLSRKEKTKDIELLKEDSETVVAIYDLQAVMPVTDLKDNVTNCYFWHEGLGNREAIEIGSCVFKFLKDTAERHPNSNIIFYSDNCCGQQKNRFLIGMYYYAVEILPLKSITHKFLIRGHTQNEGDNAHSLIERSIKRAKKSGPIYVPYQYVQLIRTTKKSGNTFVVNELNYDDFYDLKKLFEDITLNVNKDLQGNPIKLSDIKVIRFVKNSETYDLKYSYDSEWVTVKSKTTVNTRNTGDPGESIGNNGHRTTDCLGTNTFKRFSIIKTCHGDWRGLLFS
ncbi:unnamed protein product [Chrysodeixis includens]|uniref:DUF7869 domain-containing protein n=1 Tax=Chrysodeixis includens TaxID=689277 RepID=A0A9P0E1W9_CHRIL|nr:unnamed protein product [Chrysodeixis includens]